MPIYEFYCPDCHTIFNFFARTSNTTKRPVCPRCQRKNLDRMFSRFAVSKGRAEPTAAGEELPDMDESKMEQVLAEMERESAGMNEDDPRQMGRMMRKLYESTGLWLGENMAEAIRRMEAGEDPDTIEAEMEDLLEAEEPQLGESGGGLRQFSKRLKPPTVDETLYDL